jgi:hypothetical protein
LHPQCVTHWGCFFKVLPPIEKLKKLLTAQQNLP